MAGSDELEQQRLAKIERLRAQGVDPYPVRFERAATAKQLHDEFAAIEAGSATGHTTSVAGRLMLKRTQGKLTFLVVKDTTGAIQLFCDARGLGDDAYARALELDLGDWIGAGGEVIKTKRGELSVRASAVALLSKAIRPLPDKWHGLADVEQRYRQRYVDLIVNERSQEIARIRIDTVDRIRSFMTSREFMEVETPMLQVQPGGATARPFVTHLNALDIDLFMRVAPELYLKRLVVGGFERVFEINRNFRNEGVSTRHNPEFTMLEAYQAYADYFDMMELMQAIVQSTIDNDTIEYQGRPLKLGGEWRRATMLDLVREAIDHPDLSYDWDVERVRALCETGDVPYEKGWGTGKLIAGLFEHHVEHELWDPTLVMDYPVEVSPLARKHRDDPNVTERFEPIVAGRELGNAFSELNDPIEQRARFEAQARARAAGDEEAMPIDEDYLRALEYGMPPAGGLGLGIDRLVMLLTDVSSIREVLLFPFMRPEG
ncbi:MAG: lysine--tRNA ligase [Actinomycetota bacterium]